MKLRNKKTGEVIELKLIQTNCRCLTEHEIDTIYGKEISLETLNKYCEDYEPQEPFIEDEKKLDAVKSFFALLGITKEIYYQSVNNCFYYTDDGGITYGIDFDDDNGIDDICTGIAFTLAELCGEEE